MLHQFDSWKVGLCFLKCDFDLSRQLFLFPSGPIPVGADAVVQVEDTQLIESASVDSKRVRILKQIKQGVDIRPVVWIFYLFAKSVVYQLHFTVKRFILIT